MAEETRASVELALESEIVEVDGEFQCRVCTRRFPSRRSVPVHELVHRRAVGLAPPPHTGNTKGPEYIRCLYNGCQDYMARTSLSPHLQGKKHGLDRTAASFFARKRMDEERLNNTGRTSSGTAVLARLDEEEGEFDQPSPMTDLAAVEAVTGILSAARNDGVIPTKLLPAIYDLIEHTDDLLRELRKLTNG